jgi:hypothetical protein
MAHGIIFEYLMTLMRKNFIIFFVIIHLLGNTELGQLLRIPQLISHYLQHHSQNPGIDFLGFITMHYFGDDGTTADDNLDKQLPCHNINHSSIAVVYSPMVKDASPIRKCFFVENEFYECLQVSIFSKHVSLILQPPRIA